MYIKKTTKTRSSLGSEKMIKTTKNFVPVILKIKRWEKSIPWWGEKSAI